MTKDTMIKAILNGALPLFSGLGTFFIIRWFKTRKTAKQNCKNGFPEAKCKSPYFIQAGQKLTGIREIFNVTQRVFAWRFNCNVSDIEEYEAGNKEIPRALLDELIVAYHVDAEFLDGIVGSPFRKITHSADKIENFIRNGFKAFFITAPLNDIERSSLSVYTVLFKNDDYIPYCFVTTGVGSFSSKGGKTGIFEVLNGINNGHKYKTCVDIPMVYHATPSAWNSLHLNKFYMKEIFFGGGCIDDKCSDILRSWTEEWMSRRK